MFYGTSSQGLNASPTTVITTLDKQRFDLDSTGNTTLVSFYSPSCSFCQKDATTLNALQQDFLQRKVNVIAVAMPYDTNDDIAQFRQKNDVVYHVAHDTDGAIANSFPDVRFTPTTFLLDKSGRIIWRHTGKLRIAEITQEIEQDIQR
ncbi:MAG: TlpA disulfide reductase family protein, partial [Pseudomonadota bacterium]